MRRDGKGGRSRGRWACIRSLRRHVLWNGSHSRPISSSTMFAVRTARVRTDEYLLTISKRYEQPVDVLGVGGVHAVEREATVPQQGGGMVRFDNARLCQVAVHPSCDAVLRRGVSVGRRRTGSRSIIAHAPQRSIGSLHGGVGQECTALSSLTSGGRGNHAFLRF